MSNHHNIILNNVKLKSLFYIVLLLFSINIIPISSILAEESVTYDGSVKPLDFYFHYLDNPSKVGGLETKYIMNTSRQFRFNNNHEAYSVSFFKPIGLPKISTVFYLSPNFLSPVTFDGDWKVSIWINSTAYKPVTFGLQYKEVSQKGLVIWDSGQLSPSVTSSIGEHLDVPVHDYVLSSKLQHTFSVGSTLQVSVEVNAGSSSAIRVWFDSYLYPTKITLPVKDYARPVSAQLYSYDEAKTDLFDYSWSQEKRTITFKVNVSDPFGGYDVKDVSMIIFFNKTQKVSEEIKLEPETINYNQVPTQIYSTTWSYPLSIPIGNYSVKINVIDNNGYYKNLDTGSPEPYVESLLHEFQIGPITYFDPVFYVIDDTGDPLQNAQIYVTLPNGIRDSIPRYTGMGGNITLQKVLPGEYELTVIWKDIVVNQTSLKINSDGPFNISTQVYELRVNVTDNNGSPIKRAYILVYSMNGLGYGFDITSENGQAEIKIPQGTYKVESHYSNVFWLTQVTTFKEEYPVIVTDNITLKITTENYPPPIWQTTGFMIAIIIAITIIVAIILIKKKRKQK
ncbi:hypothetical protein JW865_07055 [Candidatus Bathyarchaeota archaeon]|nr:hypothetical protein [Candidatus Bathyarchaeota archaeon]